VRHYFVIAAPARSSVGSGDRSVSELETAMSVQANQEVTGAFAREWEKWHRNVEARLADPHGFLAITSLHWLARAPQSYPDALGQWWTGEDGPTVQLGAAEELVIDGRPVRSMQHRFGIIPERGSIMVVWGDAVLEVAKRGGHDILRPRTRTTPCASPIGGPPHTPPIPAGGSPDVSCPSISHARRRSVPLSKVLSTCTTRLAQSRSNWTAMSCR